MSNKVRTLHDCNHDTLYISWRSAMDVYQCQAVVWIMEALNRHGKILAEALDNPVNTDTNPDGADDEALQDVYCHAFIGRTPPNNLKDGIEYLKEIGMVKFQDGFYTF